MTDQKMKRRYIYMDDETWEELRREADAHDITMSDTVRRFTKFLTKRHLPVESEPRHDTPTSHLHLPEEK